MHLTNNASKASDELASIAKVVDAGAPADEIKITPEMIAAGEDALLSELGGAVSSYWWPDKLAKEVYLAMEACNRKVIDLSEKQK